VAGCDAEPVQFEHWHDEDEVRFIIAGRGLFHIHPREGDVISITVETGDLLRVPRGTWHWFDLCQEKRIRAIRLFQDTSGWTPHYTESGADRGFEPVCLAVLHRAARIDVSDDCKAVKELSWRS
jgi:1,2-dihydroxy-3-keto-5-methylthiopentene dioxygenase